MNDLHRFYIETPRLRLRPVAPEDADDLHRLWTDPDVRRYLWDDEVIPRGQTAALIGDSLAYFHQHRFGLWGLFPKDGGALLGFCGYWFFHDPPERQLLVGLAPTCWGRGLATEAARAMLRYGFEALGFDSVRASADAPNAASLRLMEAIGMTFEKRVRANGLDTVYYAMSRAAFERHERAGNPT